MKPTSLKDRIAAFLMGSMNWDQHERAERILRIVKEHNEREGETQLELTESGKSKVTLVIRNPDGSVKHMTVHKDNFIKGEPRPTVPGAYWNPDKSASEVWTLHKNGSWRNNLQNSYTYSPSEVPEGLTLLGAF